MMGVAWKIAKDIDTESDLLNQLALTDAVVWSPQADRGSVEALAELLVAAQDGANACW